MVVESIVVEPRIREDDESSEKEAASRASLFSTMPPPN